MGFKFIGKEVLISDRASIYNAKNISIGDHTRIDDFCLLSAGEGGIELGKYIHIGAGSSLIGKGKITMEDFSGISGKVSIYSSSDDYSGAVMTNATVPDKYKNVDHRPVTLCRHALVGCGAVLLPGTILEEGAVVGALSLVRHKCQAWTTNLGIPATKTKDRKRDVLDMERLLEEELRGENE
jgi:galactoside O-acetyltransferase